MFCRVLLTDADVRDIIYITSWRVTTCLITSSCVSCWFTTPTKLITMGGLLSGAPFYLFFNTISWLRGRKSNTGESSELRPSPVTWLGGASNSISWQRKGGWGLITLYYGKEREGPIMVGANNVLSRGIKILWGWGARREIFLSRPKNIIKGEIVTHLN